MKLTTTTAYVPDKSETELDVHYWSSTNLDWVPSCAVRKEKEVYVLSKEEMKELLNKAWEANTCYETDFSESDKQEFLKQQGLTD